MGDKIDKSVKNVLVEDNRNGFLDFIYNENIVVADPFSRFFSDKLFYYDYLMAKVPDVTQRLLPKTKGLRSVAETLLNQDDEPCLEVIDQFLKEHFPNKILMKPASEIDSDGSSIVFDHETILRKILKEIDQPSGDFVSPLVNHVVSGDEWILQEVVPLEASKEFRVHTLGDQIVEGATSCRWDHFYDPKIFTELNTKLQKEWDKIPKDIVEKQAWGLDVFFDGENLKIVDINTNRGEKKQWSGDMVVPDIMGAYARHIEKHYPYHFQGPSGEKLRTDQASPKKWIKSMGEKKVQEYLDLKEQAMLSP